MIGVDFMLLISLGHEQIIQWFVKFDSNSVWDDFFVEIFYTQNGCGAKFISQYIDLFIHFFDIFRTIQSALHKCGRRISSAVKEF